MKPQSLSICSSTVVLDGNMNILMGMLGYKLARDLTGIFQVSIDMTIGDMKAADGVGGTYTSFMLMIESGLEKFKITHHWKSIVDLEYYGVSLDELVVNDIETGIRIIHLKTSDPEYFDVIYCSESAHQRALANLDKVYVVVSTKDDESEYTLHSAYIDEGVAVAEEDRLLEKLVADENVEEDVDTGWHVWVEELPLDKK